MGYSTLFYSVDLERLSASVGSNDKTLSDLFAQKFPDELERRLDDDEPILADAFADLVSNTFNHPDSGHQYGYALEILCGLIGDHLPDEDAIGHLGPLDIASPLESPRHPIDIPKELEDFPRISYMKPTDVKSESARLSSIDIAFPNDEDIEEAREAYKNCIDLAAEQNLAVVTFYY